MEETRHKYNDWCEGYLNNNREIIYVYDPPHIFKLIRNNLLTRNVIFTWHGERQMTV